MNGPLYLGLDIGTSGVRTAVVDRAGELVSEARLSLERHVVGEGVDAEDWWAAARNVLREQTGRLGARADNIRALAVDGTSGSMVAVDTDGATLGPGLVYDSKGFAAEAALVARHAPAGSVTLGTGSALARALRLLKGAPGGARLAHQADLVTARLTGRVGVSDESNALKTGWDAEARRWPEWVAPILREAGLSPEVLPAVVPVGGAMGEVSERAARETGLRPGTHVVAGTTDSVAAFLASGERQPGAAVTSLGSTIALKIVSPSRVEDGARGIYSHRIGDTWLAGGASNAGGRVLLTQFSPEEIEPVSTRIDPNIPTGLDYVPLPSRGERFPVNDPDLEPRLTPRPRDDATFLLALFEAMARVERDGYRALADLGAPFPERILTAGGGAANATWSAVRERVIGVPVEPLERAEASVGMALLARDASS